MVRSAQSMACSTCPHCGSEQINKNGHRRGKQNYRCKTCDRQFIETYTSRGYSEEIKRLCVEMYRRGLKLRQVEQFTGIPRSTLSHWVKQAGLVSGARADSLR
ncbi:hypothetical protein K9N68_14600 [Kovacikia minuta CCNUW1]|uniref:IS1/IS1595 family N-terminal zinc-binding domain-containing protein n=1 Tax=Kovacikia minuta TaxID=2931930 RepID=UPI001CC9A4B3|nr:hypothetical protein [Kovacikia minuta]UBF28956.1 hypothetical protein K9N68_14600 [Kovacikia minuta CCNUW1]